VELSSNPEVLRQQLLDIVSHSEKMLAELTSPVCILNSAELAAISLLGSTEMHGSRVYAPPESRFGRLAGRRSSPVSLCISITEYG